MVGVGGVGTLGAASPMGPGEAGWGVLAVLLLEPGSTVASESLMLGFVFAYDLFQ